MSKYEFLNVAGEPFLVVRILSVYNCSFWFCVFCVQSGIGA